ncbi:divergent polysaccharide deacetylase family protein [Hyphobacterium sp. HN65]|uniref:Divergent polysaccharide deacetylase family protein n=1 Tax=Hyphobacterium lacteum TaxID=3116575 RepID=A0ABU7LSJ7_9PROT|nr:divergent polysaccharide deacetylase family protein [Hyphobacterium sp. HN65]MEE2526893.1 divergent polysaccharide deacetylase family protein [Hyphobacterium sp. HN65]
MSSSTFSAASAFKGPAFAGLGAALFFALGATLIAFLGDADGRPPVARQALGPAPVVRAEEVHTAEVRRPVEFTQTDTEIEPSLSGAPETFEAPQPEHGSDPARAEAEHAGQTNPEALVAAPLAGLTTPGPSGPLPSIGPDGTRPDQAYARPWHGDPNMPMISVVIGGMGLNRAVTEAAINDLPPEVALSFAPYSRDLQSWIDRARAAGHEVLIEVPMEPFDYPNNDPGPHTLLADATNAENSRRLYWLMSQATGYFAMTNYLGARFSTSEPALEHVMTTLEERGVAFLHDGTGRRSTIEAAGDGAQAHWGIADRVLDEDPSPSAVDDRLLTLEALALQNGSSIGAGFAYRSTVDQIARWTEGLEARGYALAPPSAVMARQQAERGGPARTASAAENRH